MSGADAFRPVLPSGGDSNAASERVAGELHQHLTRRAIRHGADDAAAVADGSLLGAVRFISATRGDREVIRLLKHLLADARTNAERTAAPRVLQ